LKKHTAKMMPIKVITLVTRQAGVSDVHSGGLTQEVWVALKEVKRTERGGKSLEGMREGSAEKVSSRQRCTRLSLTQRSRLSSR
jgi:hypothetical protein